MSRVVVVSNRVTVPRSSQTPRAGGMAVALSSALADHGGIWFGWDGRIEEAVPAEPAETRIDGVTYATTPLTRSEYDCYYAGFSNEVLWPLCHFMLGRMSYRPAFREGYDAVNARFARQLASLLEGDETIWVNDYHLVPLAQHLRAHGVGCPIGFFLHIPFPSYGLLKAMPGWRSWLRGLAAYDLVGVQTVDDRRALETSLIDGLGAEWAESGVRLDGHVVRTTAQPVGVEVDELARMAADSSTSRRVRRLVGSLGERDLMIGVERLDYSKGLGQRFRAYERLLEERPARQGRTVFMQIASPSRETLPEYEALKAELETHAGHINGRFADFDWVPVRYINKAFARASLLGFFRTARVGAVTPLRDGMNLVAKEFVAAQDPADPGVLVLSELAGAAAELDAAVLVNPYDIDGMAAAMERALSMRRPERIERFERMFEVLRANDLGRWRRRYLAELEATVGQRGAAVASTNPE